MNDHAQLRLTMIRRAAGILFTLLLFASLSASDALAQRAPMDRGEYLDRTMSYLSEHVELNEAQIEPIRTILGEQFDTRREMMQQFRDQGPGGMEAAREQMAQLREETNARIEALLSEEQVDGFHAFVKAEDARREARWRNRPGG